MATTPEFHERTLVGIDAMRLAAHAIMRGGEFRYEDRSVTLESYQCVVKLQRNDECIMIDIRPREGLEHGNQPAVVLLESQRLPGSPLFVSPIDQLAMTYANLFWKIAETGVVTWLSHDGDDVCIAHARIEGQRLKAAEHVDAIGRGIDALTGQPSTYMRHPGLGTVPAFEALGDEDTIASVPTEDDPDQDRRAAGARIRMAQKWCHALPDAITIRHLGGPENRFVVGCHALTVAPPADRSDALRRSIKAYMALAAMDPGSIG